MMARIRRRRLEGDRGAVLIETAVVAFLVVMLLFGMVELSFGWKNSSTGANILRAAARVGASAGNDRTADYEMLRVISTGMADLTSGGIDLVVIYKSSTADGQVPASCTTSAAIAAGGVSGVCNTYSSSDLTGLSSGSFDGTSCAVDDIDGMWCPLSRNISIDSADYVGVYMRWNVSYITQVLPGNGFTITDQSINRLEPAA